MRPRSCGASLSLVLGLFLSAQPVPAAETGKKFAGAEAGNYLEQGRRQAPTTLVSAVAASFAFSSVSQPTLFVGDNSFVINVPTGATRLDITLTTTTAAADLDMYVRYGVDVDLSAENRPVADHFSAGNSGNERVQIDATGWNGYDTSDVYQRYSTPVLRAGVYYIGLGLFTTGIAPSGTITATVTGGGGSGFNLVGPWDWSATCNTGSFSGQLQIASQQANGTIAGNFIGSQTGTINGLINGNQVIFSRSFDGRQQQWSGSVQGSAGSLTMQGTVLESNPQTSCSFTAHQNSGGGLSVFINQVIQTNCATPKVIASVTSNGIAVTGLTVSNFTLKEDSQVRTVTVTSVSGGTGGSLTAAIVIDTSTSLSSSDLENEKQAARELVNRLSSTDLIAVYAFGSSASLLQDFTTNKTALTNAINSITLGGSTALYTAIDTAARALLSQTGRKAIVLMTDGEDTVGGVTLQQAIDSARAAGAPVFTIGFGGANGTILGQIATQTGAFFTPAASSSDLQRITTAISQVVSGQYEITYTTSSSSISHTIELTVIVSAQTSTVTRTVGSCMGGGGGGGGGTCPSLTATRLELRGGSYSGGTFSSNGHIWDTDPSTAAWVIGVSDTSGPIAPFLNRSDGSIGIPTGAYYTYNRPEDYGTAVQVSVAWSDGSTSVAVFQVGSDPFSSSNWTRLSGSTNISWARFFVTDVDRVRGQNGASGFGQDGSPDDLFRLTLDCPGSGGGGGGGSAGPTVIINQVIPACPQEKLVVSVTDSLGVAITGLTVSNFVLREDSQTRTITVTNVTQTGSLTMAIVVDTSTSLSSSDLENEKQAARELVNRLSSSDRIAIYAFGSSVSLRQDFTTNRTALINAINSISLGGSTALYQAIDTAAKALRSQSGRKAVVLLTDGEDTVGGVTLQQAIDSAKAAGAPVFTIGFGGANHTILTQIARDTGGFHSQSASSSDLQRIATAISQVFSSQYEVTYTTSSVTISHTIELTVIITATQQTTVTRVVEACSSSGGGGGGGTCSGSVTRIDMSALDTGGHWDTDPNTGFWSIGVSNNTSTSAPLLNTSTGISIGGGSYYMYAAPFSLGARIQFGLPGATATPTPPSSRLAERRPGRVCRDRALSRWAAPICPPIASARTITR